MRVEVKVVGIQFVVNRLQGIHRVGAVSAVIFAEILTEKGVLRLRQDLVADVLVSGHTTLSCCAGLHHSASEDGVCLASCQGLDQPRQLLGRVLAVTVNQCHKIEIAGYCVSVANLLIPAVALVVAIPEHRQPHLGMRLCVCASDFIRAIFRGVIDDQNLDVEIIHDLIGNAIEDLSQCRLGVIGNDKDQQPPTNCARCGSDAHRAVGVRRRNLRRNAIDTGVGNCLVIGKCLVANRIEISAPGTSSSDW